MRILLVSNASASSVIARTRVLVRRALADEHEVTETMTARRGNATAIAAGAAHKGIDVVVMLGGDGTVNEVANGLIDTSTALAVLPGGSTNVFARAIGTPDDPLVAVEAVLAGLRAETTRRVGVGTINGRVFTFHTGLGFDGAVVERVEARARLKRYASHPLFAWSALAEWRHRKGEQPLMQVEFADGEVVEDAVFVVVLNLDPYTYVGTRPLHLSTDATLDRGLVVVALRSLAARALVPLVVSALGSGRRIRNHASVVYRSDLDRLLVRGNQAMPHQVDGDSLGSTLRAEFEHRPRSLDLVMPISDDRERRGDRQRR